MAPKMTNEDFLIKLKEKVGDEYTVLGEYVNVRTKILMKHNICGFQYEVRPNDFQQGKRCAKCAGNLAKTHESFLQEIYDLVGTEYTVISDYVSVNDYVTVKHNKCGNIYEVTPSNFLYRERRCARCKHSKGEKRVEEFLKENNLNYKTQYFFKDLIGIGGAYLRFDFAVFEGKGLKCLIEYDGEFHFKPEKFTGGECGLKKQQERDKMKDEYCKTNNIPLIRIPYWEFKNIHKTLNILI